jgi:hypothetical protein
MKHALCTAIALAGLVLGGCATKPGNGSSGFSQSYAIQQDTIKRQQDLRRDQSRYETYIGVNRERPASPPLPYGW